MESINIFEIAPKTSDYNSLTEKKKLNFNAIFMFALWTLCPFYYHRAFIELVLCV